MNSKIRQLNRSFILVLGSALVLISCRAAELSRGKIIGGTKAANPGYFVTIHNKYDRSGKNPSCGGAFIEENVILTAAHCVNSITGAVKFSDGKKSELIKISTKTVHEGYASDQVPVNDIALLFLNKESLEKAKENSPELMNKLSPVWLNTDRKFLENHRLATAFGEGNMTSIGRMRQSGLRKVSLKIEDNSVCQKGLKEVSPYISLGDGHLCTFNSKGGKDTCQGDSGGPLVVDSLVDVNPTIVGVTSYGVGCAQPSQGGIFTRVISYIPWIQDKIRSYNERLNFSKEDFIASPSLLATDYVKKYLTRKISVMCYGSGEEREDKTPEKSKDPSVFVTKLFKYKYAEARLSSEERISKDSITSKPVCMFQDSVLGVVKIRSRAEWDPYDDYSDPFDSQEFVLSSDLVSTVVRLGFKKQEYYKYQCESERFGNVTVQQNELGYFLSTTNSYHTYRKDKNLFAAFFTKTQDSCDFGGQKISFEQAENSDGQLYVKSMVFRNRFGFKTKYNLAKTVLPTKSLETKLSYSESDKTAVLTIHNPSETHLYGLQISCIGAFSANLSSGKVESVFDDGSEGGDATIYLNPKDHSEATINPGETKTIPLAFNADYISKENLTCEINKSYTVSPL